MRWICGIFQTVAIASCAVWVTPCAPYSSPTRPTTSPSVLPCSALLLAGLKFSPMTGNWCSVRSSPVPSDCAPMYPSSCITTSSSGKIAVNPYQARATTTRLALSSPNFFTTAYGTPAQRTRRCQRSTAPITALSGSAGFTARSRCP